MKKHTDVCIADHEPLHVLAKKSVECAITFKTSFHCPFKARTWGHINYNGLKPRTLRYNGSISFENVAGEQEASQSKQLIFSYHLLGPPPCDGLSALLRTTILFEIKTFELNIEENSLHICLDHLGTVWTEVKMPRKMQRRKSERENSVDHILKRTSPSVSPPSSPSDMSSSSEQMFKTFTNISVTETKTMSSVRT